MRLTVDSAAIAELAYRFWQQRGCPFGSPEVDWFRAEHELQSRTPPPLEPELISLAKTLGEMVGTVTAFLNSLRAGPAVK